MDHATLWDRAVAHLEAKIEERGIRRKTLGKKVGRAENYVYRSLRDPLADPDKPRWNAVIRIARGMEYPLDAFFAEIIDRRPHVVFGQLAPERLPHGPKLLFVERFGELHRLLPLPSRAKSESPEYRAGLEELGELENLRHTKPGEVERECETAVEEALRQGKALTPHAAFGIVGKLAIWGTLRRKARDLGSAREAMAVSLRCAEEIHSPWLVARTLQRAAYVLRDFDEIEEGLVLLDRATQIYARHGNRDGLGQVQVDHSDLLYHLDRLDDAEQAATGALKVLSKSNWRNRSSAWWIRAQAAIQREELPIAVQALSEASDLTIDRDPHLWACHQKSLGDILVRLGSYESAISRYRKGAEVFLLLGEAEEALDLSLGQAMVLIKANRLGELRKLTRELRSGLERYAFERPGFEKKLARIVQVLTEERPSIRKVEEIRASLEKET